ncbi:hypothetical protein LSAT2_018561 [Lamellibrachia satsuma]|nr:hypothetical protein LSAT2_018561 [Lamellibrachia satsuma]
MAASAKEKFTAAVNVVRTLPKDGSFQPSREMMLKFYAFYKQATCGSCTDAKPGFWDVIGKAKWEAWSDLQEMSEEDAMTNYVEQLKQIVEAMPHSDSVQTFIEKLGSFYEMVDTNTINSRSSKRNNNDVTKSLEALTEKPFGEGETECAALVGGTNTAQYVAFESTTNHTDSTGDSGTVSSDTSSDDEIVSVVSQPQKALSSDDTTHLTNGDTIHCDDASPLTNGDWSVPETSQDTKVTIQDNDSQSVTSQDYDSDTEVYCDTSDLPLVEHCLCLAGRTLSPLSGG